MANPVAPGTPPTPGAVISVRDLTKTYQVGDIEVRALRGASLDVNKGEFVCITGPSGSGKSTIMHIIGCLDRPTSGNYFLDGKDVSRMSKDELAIIEFVRELYKTRRVSDKTYKRVHGFLGDAGVVELVGICGYYAMISMTLNVFRAQIPADAELPFAEPK